MLTPYGQGPHNEWVNMGSFLQFFMSHNQLVFGILLAAIFGLCAFLLYRLFFEERSETHSASSSDVGQIEETLKKILSQTTNMTPASGPAGPEVEKMKTELEISQQMIAELKAKTENGKSDNTPELLAKIKILEDRLSEYEIIEDDIADLSVYKEENAKLKKQLESIKAGQSSPMVEDFAAAVENAPVGTELRGESVEEAIAAAEALSLDSTGPLDDALEAAMAEMNEPAFVPPKAADEPTQTTTISSTDDVPGTEDVFAEFQGDENKDLLSELGDIDADRMLEEIKDLGEGMQADSNVLDEEVDLDKMAKESAKG